MPAGQQKTITPRRAIKNFEAKALINLGYVALGVDPARDAYVRPQRPSRSRVTR